MRALSAEVLCHGKVALLRGLQAKSMFNGMRKEPTDLRHIPVERGLVSNRVHNERLNLVSMRVERVRPVPCASTSTEVT